MGELSPTDHREDGAMAARPGDEASIAREYLRDEGRLDEFVDALLATRYLCKRLPREHFHDGQVLFAGPLNAMLNAIRELSHRVSLLEDKGGSPAPTSQAPARRSPEQESDVISSGPLKIRLSNAITKRDEEFVFGQDESVNALLSYFEEHHRFGAGKLKLLVDGRLCDRNEMLIDVVRSSPRRIEIGRNEQ